MLDKLMLAIRPEDREHSLNKPATQEQINNTEKCLRVEFPESLKNLYKKANGESGTLLSSKNKLNQLFYVFDFLTLKNVESTHKLHNEAYADYFGEIQCYPENYIQPAFFNAMWIPFAFAGSAIYLAVDMDPGPKGTAGQVIVYGADALPLYFVLSPDVNTFLNSLADYVYLCLTSNHHFQDASYFNNAYRFYESEEWRNYSDDEYQNLLRSGKLPFWRL